MLGRIPLPKRVDLMRWRTGHHIAALHGEKPPAHRRTVHRFDVALGQLVDVDAVEDGKTGQLGGSVAARRRLSFSAVCDVKKMFAFCGRLRWCPRGGWRKKNPPSAGGKHLKKKANRGGRVWPGRNKPFPRAGARPRPPPAAPFSGRA